jgi:hypothetical protein
MASLLVLLSLTPPPTSLPKYALMRGAMAEIATWIVLPSLVATLIAGLLAIAVTRAFHDAGWAWVKAATGILMFAGGLHALSPIQEEATRSASALAEQRDPAMLEGATDGERGTLWVLLAVSTANVALGVWRPRITRLRSRTLPQRSASEDRFAFRQNRPPQSLP